MEHFLTVQNAFSLYLGRVTFDYLHNVTETILLLVYPRQQILEKSHTTPAQYSYLLCKSNSICARILSSDSYDSIHPT